MEENHNKKCYEELKIICEDFLTKKKNISQFVEDLYLIDEEFKKFPVKKVDGRKIPGDLTEEEKAYRSKEKRKEKYLKNKSEREVENNEKENN